jgi:hypothetical protein
MMTRNNHNYAFKILADVRRHTRGIDDMLVDHRSGQSKMSLAETG